MVSLPCPAQADTLPYASIAEYPDDYAPGNVIARMIDALGFRFRYATEGLRPEDLDYRPSESARSCYETIEHIHGLSRMILAPARVDTLGLPEDISTMHYSDLRRATLQRLSKASALYLNLTAEDLRPQRLLFSTGTNSAEFPLWNVLNGPLADAIYHTGQIVTMRRASGNPMDGRVDVFRGRVRE